MNAIRKMGLAAPILALLSCGVHFAPQYLVQDLRILAARAQVKGAAGSLADGDSGDTVVLSALVANPQGLAPLRVSWKACFPVPGLSVPPCLDPAYLRDPALLETAPGLVDLGEGLSVEVAVPAELGPYLAALVGRAQSEPAYTCTLYAEIPVLAVATAGTSRQMAVKRVRLTPYRELAGTSLQDAYVPNLNPALAEVRGSPTSPTDCSSGVPAIRSCLVDADCGGVACLPAGVGAGACDDPLAGDQVTLCTLAAPGSAQIYSECNPDGSRLPRDESLTYQWYTSAGTFGSRDPSAGAGSGNQTGDRVTFFPPAGPATMWVIVRDGRGGVGWLQRDFR